LPLREFGTNLSPSDLIERTAQADTRSSNPYEAKPTELVDSNDGVDRILRIQRYRSANQTRATKAPPNEAAAKARPGTRRQTDDNPDSRA